MDRNIVVEASQAAVDQALAELRDAGWHVVESWTAPLPIGRRAVRAGTVADAPGAELALLAALAGARIVVVARAERHIIDTLIDDLRRLGPVEHRLIDPPAQEPMDPTARAILGLLAEGLSLGEAAESLGLARRTADRRLAAARRALGVERTTEAIARARRLGWLQSKTRPEAGA